MGWPTEYAEDTEAERQGSFYRRDVPRADMGLGPCRVSYAARPSRPRPEVAVHLEGLLDAALEGDAGAEVLFEEGDDGFEGFFAF